MNIISIFITGLFAGGLTCLAVQGGLLATLITQQESEKLKDKTQSSSHFIPIISFLSSRLIAYTILGFLLGALGSLTQLSVTTRIVLQISVSLFMLGTAFNLLQIHPFFRYFVITPPKSFMRLIRNQSKSKNIFAPAILGTMTVLIPCGVTQAMIAYAVTTGSPIAGASTLFIFILGTSPLFFILGYSLRQLSQFFGLFFNKIAAVALILVAVYNINGAIALTSSQFTLENLWSKTICYINACDYSSSTDATPVSEAIIYINSNYYQTDPETITVKAGSRVTLTIINRDGYGCIQAFTIPVLNIQKIIPPGKSEKIVIKVPKKTGPLPFMCSMGMYRGVIQVL